MDKVQAALDLAGYHHTARFLREVTVDDLQMVRIIVTAQIDTLGPDDPKALLCAEAVREIDRKIKEVA